MASLNEFRQQHPEYSNRSDMELAQALHQKFYSQMEFGTFARKVGLLDEAPASPVADYNAVRKDSSGGPTFTQPIEYRTALEGAGKFFTDTGLGARQMARGVWDAMGRYGYGRTSMPGPADNRLQQEAAAKREIDAPLMETGAGKAGYVGAGVLSSLPAMAIPGAASIPGSAAIGAGLGALQPTTTQGERLINTGVGGAVGAAIPGAIKYAPQAFSALRRFAAGPAAETAEQIAARSTTGGSAGASAAAVDVGGVTPDMRQSIVAAGGRGRPVSSDVLSRHVEADTLPVPIRLTAGEATQDPVLISQERNLRGKHTEMAQRMDETNKALGQNMQALRDQVGERVFSTNMVEHGDALIAAYRAQDAIAEKAVNVAYHRLRQAAGGDIPVDARTVLSNATASLHRKLLFDHAPPEIMRTLSRLAENNSMTFENFEALRTNLARIARSGADGNVKAAAGVIRQELESLPLRPGAEHLKTAADAARAMARRRFQALEADPAYDAAVNGTVPAEKFVQRFIINAPREELATTMRNLQGQRETVSVAVLDHLRDAARLDPGYNGNFSTAGYSRALEALNPKANLIFDARTAETLGKLRNVAGYTTFQPRGSFVNNSNTLVGSLSDMGASALEGAVNASAGGVPLGTLGRVIGRNVLGKRETRRLIENSLKRGAGLEQPRNVLIQEQ